MGDIGLVGIFLSFDLLRGFLGTFSLEFVDLFSFLSLVALEFDVIEISKALSLMRLKAPTRSAADLSEFEVA